MLMEPSILDNKIIAQLLNRYYGLSVVNVEKMRQSTANCYRVFVKDKCYFLKEFPTSVSKEDIIKEAKLVDFLADKGFAAARFCDTADADKCIEYKGHCICLQEYIDGKTYFKEDFPASLLAETARTLGKLHNILKEYPLQDDKIQKWKNDFSAAASIQKFDNLLFEMDRLPPDPNFLDIKSDLQYKKELVIRCEGYLKYFDTARCSVVHGDYQGCQLIFDDDGKVNAVIDFSLLRKAPFVWELMRSFVYTSYMAVTKSEIDVEELKNYVREYMKYNPLEAHELVAMPYIYVSTVASETFGYVKYLDKNSTNRKGKLDVALRRTAVCRDIEKKAAEITKALTSLTD